MNDITYILVHLPQMDILGAKNALCCVNQIIMKYSSRIEC
jgi:hypothetical protein